MGKRIIDLAAINEQTSLADFFAEIDKEGIPESLKISLIRLMGQIINSGGYTIAKAEGNILQVIGIESLDLGAIGEKQKYPIVQGSHRMYSSIESLGLDSTATIIDIVKKLGVGDGIYAAVGTATAPQLALPASSGHLSIVKTSAIYCMIQFLATDFTSGNAAIYVGTYTNYPADTFFGWRGLSMVGQSGGIVMGGVISGGAKDSHYQKDFTVAIAPNTIKVTHNLGAFAYTLSSSMYSGTLGILPYGVFQTQNYFEIQFESGVDVAEIVFRFAILGTFPQI